MTSILRMVDGIFTSKVRYGPQLLGKVRLVSDDPEGGDFKAIQLVMNKLLRTLNGTKIKVKISTKSLLEKFGMLSINQLNAQVKLLEIWKATNVDNYPLKIQQQSAHQLGVITRASQRGRPIEVGKSNLTKSTCVSDAVRIWNMAPENVTGAKSLYQAKNAIKAFVKSLPI